jgi:glycosyltransferase involved in cell wall biosynthesis
MKVLHVIPSLAARTGGPAVAAVEFARVASQNGIESAILATEAAYPAGTREGRSVEDGELVEGAEEVFVRLFPVRRPYRLARSPRLRDGLRRAVGGYDVVHIHSLYLDPQHAAAKAARRRGVPYVVSPHGALDPWLRERGRVRKAVVGVMWQRRMLQRAAALHFTTGDEARLAADVAPDVPRMVVPLGIDWKGFQELPPPMSFGAGPVVLSLGRIAAKKGLDLLIRAFALASRRFDSTRLVIAGPDDEGLQPELEALAKREGVGEQVVFPGMLHGYDKLAALAAADVWALASHTENFGIAVVEALAAGLPTLISPAVNLSGEIERAGAGLVSETKPEAFAGALAYLLEDEGRRRQYAQRGREFARRFDWDAVAPQIVGMYEKVAGWARR